MNRAKHKTHWLRRAYDSKRTSLIYVIRDAQTQEVRYVGQTTKPQQRFRSHRSTHKTELGSWIQSQRRNGTPPLFQIIAETCRANASSEEAKEIRQERKFGSRLFNKTATEPVLEDGVCAF